MSTMSSKFSIGESLVCIRAQDAKPYPAKVTGIEEGHYVIHYQNTGKKHDEMVKIGKERGKMYKGTMEDYERRKAGNPRESMDKENGDGARRRRSAVEVKKEEEKKPGTSSATAAVVEKTHTPLFQLKESLVVLYHGVPYAAKITNLKDDHYVVHYCGFKRGQDERIDFGMEEGKMFKMNLTEYAKRFNVEISKQALEWERLGQPKEAPAVVPEKPKVSIWHVVDPAYKIEKIELTENLMEVLKTDYVFVRQQGMISVIPAEYPVEKIMEEYAAELEKRNQEKRQATPAKEMYYLTLTDYFNEKFMTAVLMEPERKPHEQRVREVLKAKKIRFRSIATVHRNDYVATSDYGIAHLLRLIYRFDELMNCLPYSHEGHVERVKASIDDFVQFLDANWAKYYDQENGYKKIVNA